MESGKALAICSSSDFGMVTDESELQPSKAPVPISVTAEGMVTDESELQPSKAPVPGTPTPECRTSAKTSPLLPLYATKDTDSTILNATGS